MRQRSSDSVRIVFPALSREQLVERLCEGVSALRAELPIRRAVLFGSWATGRATAYSDIDLLVVYSDPRRDDAYELVRRCVSIRGLEPHVYTETEASLVDATLERMTRAGIQLLEPVPGAGSERTDVSTCHPAFREQGRDRQAPR